MTNNMHPKCNNCNSLMIVVGEENGYRIWECPDCGDIEDDSLSAIPHWVEDDILARDNDKYN